MFLRFYNQSDENIDRCINELRPYFKGLKEVQKGKITNSVNLFLPPETNGRKNVEVTLVFDTKVNEDAAHKNPMGLAIYQRYASGDGDAEAVLRNPGDPMPQPRVSVNSVPGMPGLFHVGVTPSINVRSQCRSRKHRTTAPVIDQKKQNRFDDSLLDD